MADNYIETVKAKRQQAAFAKVLQTPRQSVILATENGLGKKVDDATAQIIEALHKLGDDSTDGKEISLLEQLLNGVNKLQVAIDRQTIQLMSSLRKQQPVPLQPTVKKPNNNLNDYKAHDLDNADGGIQYVGFINPDGKWYIMENDSEHNTLRYYFGSGDYGKAWDTRHDHTYKLLSEAKRG